MLHYKQKLLIVNIFIYVMKIILKVWKEAKLHMNNHIFYQVSISITVLTKAIF